MLGAQLLVLYITLEASPEKASRITLKREGGVEITSSFLIVFLIFFLGGWGIFFHISPLKLEVLSPKIVKNHPGA